MNKIFNEDCLITMDRDELKNQVDLVITSPPYNMTPRKGGWADKTNRYDSYRDWLPEQEYLDFIVNVFNGYDKILKKDGCILFNFSYSIENPALPYHMVSEICRRTNFDMADTIVWKKPTALPHSTSKNRLRRVCEFVYVFARKDELRTFESHRNFNVGKNGQKYYEIFDNYIEAKNNDGKNGLNQAVFSTEFVEKLLNMYGKKDILVYDSFMGVGTTAKACIKNNMRYIGSEISEKQIDYFYESIKE